MYENKKVYGPYVRKDGRMIVILKTPGSSKDHQTISYPKYLVECYLNRYLEENETVDHIDGNFSNNSLTNLRVVTRSEHCKSHVSIREDHIKTCVICGKEFTTNRNSRITCGSKSCRGRCAHINGHNNGNSIKRDTNTYKNLRYILDSNLSIKQKVNSI